LYIEVQVTKFLPSVTLPAFYFCICP